MQLFVLLLSSHPFVNIGNTTCPLWEQGEGQCNKPENSDLISWVKLVSPFIGKKIAMKNKMQDNHNSQNSEQNGAPI